jgi:Peptidase family C25
MKVFVNGIDPLSRQLLFPPIYQEYLGMNIFGSVLQNQQTINNLSRSTHMTTAFKFGLPMILSKEKTPLAKLNDVTQAGWTFLVNSKDAHVSDSIEILQPLAKHRGMADPKAPLVFNGESPDQWFDWFENNYYSPLSEGKSVPRYILIVGDPQMIPFKFQSILDSAAYVGRIDFDSRDHITTYVNKVLKFEKDNSALPSKEAIVMGTNYGPGDPTFYSANYLVKPISSYISSKLGFKTKTLMDQQASKSSFLQSLKQSKPALVFSATHGAGFRDENFFTQKKLNGSIYCQGETDTPIDDILFTSYDVPDGEPFLEGSVFFQFACFGYGTPSESDFQHWQDGGMGFNSQEDFVSDLPKRLLLHERGPIAYIGHVDLAWLQGFDDPNNPNPLSQYDNRITPFIDSCRLLLSGEPVGQSLEEMNKRYDIENAIISNRIDQARKGRIEFSDEFYSKIAEMYIIRSDAQNYMLLGDPAVKLNVTSGK